MTTTQTPYDVLEAEYRNVCGNLSSALDMADGAFAGSSRWLKAQPVIKAAELARAEWEAAHADHVTERKARKSAEVRGSAMYQGRD